MRKRLLILALAALSAAPVAPAAADVRYYRECSGKVDSQCYHDFCGIYDCTRSDCHVYSGLLGGGNAGICFGKARPRDPVER